MAGCRSDDRHRSRKTASRRLRRTKEGHSLVNQVAATTQDLDVVQNISIALIEAKFQQPSDQQPVDKLFEAPLVDDKEVIACSTGVAPVEIKEGALAYKDQGYQL